MQRKKILNRLAYFLIFALIFCLIELIAYVSSQFIGQRAQYLIYDPPEEILEKYEAYMAERNPLLGWPSPTAYGGKKFDVSGSRIVPAFPTPGNACVSLYGASTVWSEEVEQEQAWGNILSQLLGCRVANYGVGGYGLDQAYLRFKDNEDEAPIVILIFSENLGYHINQLGMLRIGGQNIRSFKPRFIMNASEELELVPLPTFSRTEFENVFAEPKKYLPHEYFLPETFVGPRSLNFPYTLFLIKSLLNERIKTKLSGLPSFASFYSQNHPSKVFQITLKIIEQFVYDAIARGKSPHLFILPTGSGVRYYKEHKTWIHEPLIEQLKKRDIVVSNVVEPILEEIGERDYCELKTQPTTCKGHYTEEGYALLAKIMNQYLRTLHSDLGHK
jgi:hypothetical protein